MGEMLDYEVKYHPENWDVSHKKLYKPIYTLPIKPVIAKKEHECTWCGESIAKKERYNFWSSMGFSGKYNARQNRMHDECLDAALKGDFVYKPHRNKRPIKGTK